MNQPIKLTEVSKPSSFSSILEEYLEVRETYLNPPSPEYEFLGNQRNRVQRLSELSSELDSFFQKV